MTTDSLANFLLLPDLKLTRKFRLGNWGIGFEVCKTTAFEVCPKCANKSSSIYDRRTIKIKDEPIRGKAVQLLITKRRFQCSNCSKPFTEPISGISKYKRTTQRLRRGITWAAERFSNLSEVSRHYRCSPGMVYSSFYGTLELKTRQHVYPFPKRIGIDEHSIRKPKFKDVEFATIITDHSHKRVFELVDGRKKEDLYTALRSIEGRERVEAVSIDMSEGYRSFAREHFPNAKIVSDHFHVIRLFNRLINYYRKKLTGDDRKNPIRKLLLRNSKTLKYYEKAAIRKWLAQDKQMQEIYYYKEAMSRIFNMKGYERAKLALRRLCDRMGRSKLPRVSTLRKTILKWRHEILNFHRFRISNGRTEGFNRKAKLIQRKGYGYKSFENYRLRVLNECW